MKFKPHQYQDHARKCIIDNPSAGLFMEMGLGKTVTTLTAVNELMFDYFQVPKCLVIAPKKVAESTWGAEIEKWDHLKHLKLNKILGTAKQRLKAINTEANIYVINRENVVWLIEQYGKYRDPKAKTGFMFTKPWPFPMIVIDELSSFKSSKAKRFKMLRKVRPFTTRIVGLTGTPAPNNLLDLWAQLYLLDGGERLESTMTKYRDRYFMAGSMTKNAHGMLVPTSYVLRDGSESMIYDRIGDICISMKSEDWLNMPERIDNFIGLDLGKKIMDQYKELERETILELDPHVIDAGSAAAVSNKLQQFSQGAVYTDQGWVETHKIKLDALEEIIEAAQGRPVLVFYWFKHDLERLKAKFKKARELKTDQDLKDWNDGKIQLLLAHPASAGHGLNLQAGGNIITWFGMTWSLELYQQANARLHRQGQKNSVIVHHLIARGTVDEYIVAALSGKAEGQNALMRAVKAIIAGYN